jgi:stage III sporulation protein AB
MWQKLIAGILCLTGASGFGYSLCRELGRNITELKTEKQMLLYIIGEISYLHRPLEEIFDILSGRVEKPFDEFLQGISVKMRERKGKRLKDIWIGEISENISKDISKQSVIYLERMADCFECEGDRIQVESFELLCRDIEQKIDELTEKNKENSRLIRVLSTLGGIMCIVLFL